MERHVNHPIQKVWKAISTGEHISNWWSKADFKPEPGYTYTLQWDPRPDWDGKLWGTVLEAEEPYKLVYTFYTRKMGNNPPMTVTWELKEQGDGTLITLIHDGFDKLTEDMENQWLSVNGGWNLYTSHLVEFLDQTAVEATKWLNHSPDKVWEAISKAEHISQWWHPIDFNAEPGAPYTLRAKNPSGNWDGIITGKVVEADPPNKLSYTFKTSNIDYGPGMLVTFTLEGFAGGTNLTIRHTDFEKLSNQDVIWQSINKGWRSHLIDIENHLAKTDGRNQ
jgi:uncharacterized protein YndB with AHSA1/START domain